MNEKVDKGSVTKYSVLVSFRLPTLDQIESPAFYVCSSTRVDGVTHWVHQGHEPGVKLRTFQRTMPMWIQGCILTVLLVLSGLFSGLNLGEAPSFICIHCNVLFINRYQDHSKKSAYTIYKSSHLAVNSVSGCGKRCSVGTWLQNW